MTTDNNPKKRKTAGRKPKSDPAVYRYGIKLNAEENGKFELLFQKSGLSQRSKFIKIMIFEREIKTVKIDKATMDYYIRLTNFYHQFQAIGNNYNQTVKAVKTNFGDKRALALLYKLEKITMELVLLSKQIIALTREFEEKHLHRHP
ncbi:conjugal transfer protein MobA [Bacteroides uniformis]|uniref:MobA protein n=1 Tax=Bacteroides uniformis TaxID=820 RepID=A0A6I0LRI4_BACUN|nr:conjugal transfer protein MobA [Bacteroides uniformis]KAB4253874.1 MobA protein [Bacteroides uniformis]KAB4254049.1 MobA protein [Bacteroides uniformis]KAB4257617.1 MobA protein [Bacteroides uniformis]KAB4260438.1 MobA protein [Bacteroides uniformis]